MLLTAHNLEISYTTFNPTNCTRSHK